MRLALITLFWLCSTASLAQKSVYYYRGTGFDKLTLYDSLSFSSFGGVGLAQSIEYSGTWKKSSDTLFLFQTTSTIINKVDTVSLKNYSKARVDTLFIIDDLTLISHNQKSFYKLIEDYDQDLLIRKLKWDYVDTIINRSYINNFPLLDEDIKY